MVIRSRFVLLAAASFSLACPMPGEEKLFVPPTADEDPLLPQTELSVGGFPRAVHLEAFGDEDDPLVLVLHDALTDYRALGVLEELADEYHVVMWDRVGNGLSERIDDSAISDAFTLAEIAAVREAYGASDPVSLVGYGLGGALATMYAAAYPDDVASLVLIEPSPLSGDILTNNYDDIARGGLFDPSFQALAWQGEVLAAGDHARLDFRALTIVQNGGLFQDTCTDSPVVPPLWRPGGYYHVALDDLHRTGNKTFDFDYATGIDGWDGKALFIASTCSAIGSVFQYDNHLPLFGDAEIIEIAGAGHGLVAEAPDEVVDAVRDHLND